MEGHVRAATRAYDLAIAQAWHAEAFARQKRLKPLAKYLSVQPRAQSASEMLGALREMQARGAPMTIVKNEGQG